MLTRTSLHELEVDDIISGMQGGPLLPDVFAVRDPRHRKSSRLVSPAWNSLLVLVYLVVSTRMLTFSSVVGVV